MTEDFAFPLKIGNKWEYAITFSTFNIRGDTAGIKFLNTTIVANVVLETVRKDTLQNGVKTFVFHETQTFENLSLESETYYNNEVNGLFLYTRSGEHATLLKSVRKGRL